MVGGRNPVAEQRRLRAELRRLRNSAGLTQKQVATALEWSLSKVIRIEGGTVGLSITDLKALLDLYGVTSQEQIDDLSAAARASREKAWWDAFRGHASPQLIEYIAVEASASTLSEYQTFIVPGILQTTAYIRALGEEFGFDDDGTERAIAMRTERRRLLTGEHPLEARFVLDEMVIRRAIGSPGTMREQLDFLKELNRLPTVSIQVATSDRRVTRWMQSPFTIFELPDQDHHVYVDQPGCTLIARTNPDEVGRYLDAFEQLQEPAHSSPAAELDVVIDQIAKQQA
ncbi:XRE family transcriptional regulator [Amycolatopsis balhimycina DSM 5908]|uniref:XRE family transcriptional regulator n=1 Tax=Amycolatopsis balhimycina DSM 5908 TaxID=1081091 RepID=A0A428X1B5_AMYBA|nr:XRE family transcriptional regulator [Amycolatopsis balhimycina DSM 5908]